MTNFKGYGFVEVDNDFGEVAEEYNQMRASFIIQYAPELLGESVISPQLKSKSSEDLKIYIRQSVERMQRALEIPYAYLVVEPLVTRS